MLSGDLIVRRSFPLPPLFPRGRTEAGDGQGGCSPCSEIPFAFWSVFLLFQISGVGRHRALSLSAPLGFCYLDLKYFLLFHLSVCLTNELYQREGWWFLLPDKRIPAASSTNHSAPCAGHARTCNPFPSRDELPCLLLWVPDCVISGVVLLWCEKEVLGPSPCLSAAPTAPCWHRPGSGIQSQLEPLSFQGPRGLPLSGHIPK